MKIPFEILLEMQKIFLPKFSHELKYFMEKNFKTSEINFLTKEIKLLA